MTSAPVARIVRCPSCGKSVAWERTPTKPFCSKECKERDLGNWATERYRIAQEEEDPTDPRNEPDDGEC